MLSVLDVASYVFLLKEITHTRLRQIAIGVLSCSEHFGVLLGPSFGGDAFVLCLQFLFKSVLENLSKMIVDQ